MSASVAAAPSAAVPPTAAAFFAPYHGHDVAHLEAVRRLLLAGGTRRFLYLAGDSSLDNKAWLAGEEPVPAAAGWERALRPAGARLPPDVAAQINTRLAARARAGAAQSAGAGWTCINAAVEESTLAARLGGTPPAQDAWLARVLAPSDALVVSVGGNDVVLAPSLATVAALAALLLGASDAALRDGSAWGMAHVVALFKGGVEAYIARLCEHATPAAVIVCFPYFPHEGGAGWADTALACMGCKCCSRRRRWRARAHASWSRMRPTRPLRRPPVRFAVQITAARRACRQSCAQCLRARRAP